jgi:hypothetical protein
MEILTMAATTCPQHKMRDKEGMSLAYNLINQSLPTI